MEKITFSVENISEIKESEDPNFVNISIDAFASGQNSHNLFVSDETLMACADSIFDTPIVWRYDQWKDDAGGHDPEEQICGFIGRPNNTINFRKLPDGRLMMSVLGKLWKRYSGKLVDILKRDGGKKSVSVEMEISDFDKIKSEIKAFAMRAVTIIGVEPAIPDAQLTVLSFSADKENYYKNFSDKSLMKINNSKDSAVYSASWSSPGRSLYSKLLEKPNSESLVKEAYLICENGYQNSPSSALKYPHHSIKNGELVVNAKGVQSAFQRARQENVATGEVLSHIKKHYKELELDMTNFSIELGEKEENTLDKVMMEEVKEEPKFAEVEPEKEAEKEPAKETPAEEKKEEKEEVDYACKFAELEKKMQDDSAKFEAQEKELFELRKFKADREEQDKNYAVEQLMSEVSDSLPKDKTEEFRAEAKELPFSEFAAFSNKVKACTLDFVKKIPNGSGLQIMATSTPEKPEKKSVWGFSK